VPSAFRDVLAGSTRAESTTYSWKQIETLKTLLQQQTAAFGAADKATIDLIRQASGHACLDSRERASDVPAVLLVQLDQVWRESGKGPLSARVWLSRGDLDLVGLTKWVEPDLQHVIVKGFPGPRETYLFQRLRKLGLVEGVAPMT
jgi:hypothetical protein